MIDKFKAIQRLRPNALVSVLDNNVIEWMDDTQTQPTDLEISNEVTRLQGIYDSQEYARNRKTAYDNLNQLELISDDAINGTTTHKDAVLAIKDQYPKEA